MVEYQKEIYIYIHIDTHCGLGYLLIARKVHFSSKAPLYLYHACKRKSFKSHTIDLKNPAPVEVGSLSHHLQGFIHPWLLFRIFEPSMTVSQY